MSMSILMMLMLTKKVDIDMTKKVYVYVDDIDVMLMLTKKVDVDMTKKSLC